MNPKWPLKMIQLLRSSVGHSNAAWGCASEPTERGRSINPCGGPLRNPGKHAISALLCVGTFGLLFPIGCDTVSSGSGDVNADGEPTGDSNQEPVACCMADESCVVMPSDDCAFTDGAVIVDGVSSCAGDPCDSGACCSNGGCVVTTAAECDDNYQGDATSCSSSPCRFGACCVSEELGTCLDEFEDTCVNDLGGTWQGFDTACEPTKPCGGEPDYGACCTNDGDCTITDETNCLVSDHSNAGDGVDCTSGLCDVGACCAQDNSCSETGQFGCFDTFQGLGTRCVNDACPDRGGACCLPDGTCTDLNDKVECESFGAGSSFGGPGSTCLGTICPGTTGGCCLEDGSCVVVVDGEACDDLTGLSGISSTFRGAGTTCTLPQGDGACGGPLRGACCFSFGRCESATVERCALLEEGVFIGVHISCSDFERLPQTCRVR